MVDTLLINDWLKEFCHAIDTASAVSLRSLSLTAAQGSAALRGTLRAAPLLSSALSVAGTRGDIEFFNDEGNDADGAAAAGLRALTALARDSSLRPIHALVRLALFASEAHLEGAADVKVAARDLLMDLDDANPGGLGFFTHVLEALKEASIFNHTTLTSSLSFTVPATKTTTECGVLGSLTAERLLAEALFWRLHMIEEKNHGKGPNASANIMERSLPTLLARAVVSTVDFNSSSNIATTTAAISELSSSLTLVTNGGRAVSTGAMNAITRFISGVHAARFASYTASLTLGFNDSGLGDAMRVSAEAVAASAAAGCVSDTLPQLPFETSDSVSILISLGSNNPLLAVAAGAAVGAHERALRAADALTAIADDESADHVHDLVERATWLDPDDGGDPWLSYKATGVWARSTLGVDSNGIFNAARALTKLLRALQSAPSGIADIGTAGTTLSSWPRSPPSAATNTATRVRHGTRAIALARLVRYAPDAEDDAGGDDFGEGGGEGGGAILLE